MINDLLCVFDIAVWDMNPDIGLNSLKTKRCISSLNDYTIEVEQE